MHTTAEQWQRRQLLKKKMLKKIEINNKIARD